LAVKLVESQSLSERAKHIYETIARRAFELYMDDGAAHGRDREHWLQAEAELLLPVPVSVTETDHSLIVHADVPGFSAADLQIGVEATRLTIAGKKRLHEEHKVGKSIRRERSASEILRVIALPVAVDPSKATATLSNGVIELNLPKALKAKAAGAN
jgi:HSP20 family molecular chaperone IbpA